MAKASTSDITDVTLAPYKIISVSELKNGNVFVATEGKLYQLLDGKLRPLVWADVEHASVIAGGDPAVSRTSAAPSSPPPTAPPPPDPETD